MSSIPPLPSFRWTSRRYSDHAKPEAKAPANVVVDCAVYVEGRRLIDECTYQQALDEVRKQGTGFVWLGLMEPSSALMSEVAAAFGLHELAVEDAVHSHQRPKLERYDDIMFLVLRTVRYHEHDMNSVAEIVDTGDIMVFLGKDFVITVRHGDQTGLAGVRKDLEANPAQLELGPAAVLHAVADHVVDAYVEVTQEIEDDVAEMEEAVFTPANKIVIEAIYQLKREVVELRRAVKPLALPLQLLTHDQRLPLPKEIRRYMRDVTDHHTAVTEQITDFDESLSALINAALAKVSVQQNTDMRKISAYAAMAAVPTMIAGVYGMNFDHMPELRWTYGYGGVIALMALLCGLLYYNFHRNNWL
ncbi:magnesium/cobalt transporter CorA [Nocardia huaxiensis]|uniref:magnesium/cobalt transporter CorA n=1 Tax=Nocardia huaxiensis TaxID=2755382 RepID=UPI001E5E10DE|nr:magnesium/cobalt transporter CorA [Nocardia huaxiensis]UFS93438.1 magnesium/cobalt transporter CorA [Nocardia huaxiensis]